MGTTTVKWIEGKQFIGIDSTQHSVVLSTPDEGIGVKPSDLLLIAEEKYCSVAATIRATAQITTDFEILEEVTA